MISVVINIIKYADIYAKRLIKLIFVKKNQSKMLFSLLHICEGNKHAIGDFSLSYTIVYHEHRPY